MRKLIALTAVAALLAPLAPAAAQPGDRGYEDRGYEDRGVAEPLPSPDDIARMAGTFDQMLGAFLALDVGPVLDAADPARRDPEHGRRGRTLGALGERDDPDFEARLRATTRGATAGAGHMVGALAAVVPVLRRSLDEVERSVAGAVRSMPPARYEDEVEHD